jgi:hypothetical protein
MTDKAEMPDCGFQKLSDLNDMRAGEAYHNIEAWSPMQWGCAAAGEMGELCNLLKKFERANGNDAAAMVAIIDGIPDEIADVIIYLDLMLKRVNLATGGATTLREAVARKFNKTSTKIGSSVRWDTP